MTIKTQGGKVITKAGKASCECCFKCSFFDSFGFYDGKLTYEDYPDTVFLEFLTYSLILSKNASSVGEIFYKTTVDGDPVAVQSFNNRTPLPVGRFDDIYSWILTIPGEAFSLFPTLACDYEPNLPLGTDYNSPAKIRDTFANSYLISGEISGIVTRTNRNQVVYDGPFLNGNVKAINYCVEYLGNGLRLIFNGLTYKWEVNGKPKIGLQNTPVGSYGGGYSVS